MDILESSRWPMEWQKSRVLACCIGKPWMPMVMRYWSKCQPIICLQLRCAFCHHKTTHDTTKWKSNMLILAMPISCNSKLLHQSIILESMQAPQQFMQTSAWAHSYHFLQDLDTFLLQPRSVLTPAIQLHNCSMLWCLLCLSQFVSLKISMMSATRNSQKLSTASNLFTTAWGTFVSVGDSVLLGTKNLF